MPVTAYVSLKKAAQICMGFLFEIKLGLLKKKKRPEQHFYEVLDGILYQERKKEKGPRNCFRVSHPCCVQPSHPWLSSVCQLCKVPLFPKTMVAVKGCALLSCLCVLHLSGV
jgi:hypothetical protein